MITVDDVRHYWADYGELNRLNDYAEVFSDDDIIRSLDWSVEQYNAIPPMHIRITSMADIPNNHVLLLGATVYLLQRLILLKQRNHLEYNDGGVSVSDQSQHVYLAQTRQAVLAEFKESASQMKQFININDGYGSVDSQWSNIKGVFDWRNRQPAP